MSWTASFDLKRFRWLLACLPLFALVRVAPPDDAPPTEEWIPLSLSDICLDAEYFGVVLYEGRVDVDGKKYDRFQVIERLIGEASETRFEFSAQDRVYGIDCIRPLVAHETYLLSFEQSDDSYISSVRPLKDLQCYRRAVKQWRSVEHGPEESRDKREFAWLIQLLHEPALRGDAMLELFGKIYEEPTPASVAIFQSMLPQVPAAEWTKIVSDLDPERGRVEGKTWRLWYMSRPCDALPWLKNQRLRKEDIREKHLPFNPVLSFWSSAAKAIPGEAGQALADAAYDLYFACRKHRKSPAPEEVAAAERQFASVLQAIPDLE